MTQKLKNIDIIVRAKAGDRLALDMVCEEYMNLSNDFVKRYRSSSLLPEDIKSVCYVGLTKCIKYYDQTKGVQFSSLCYKFMENELFLEFRKMKKQKACVSIDAPVSNGEDSLTILETLVDNYNLTDAVITNIQVKEVRDCLLDLKENQKRVLVLRLIEGKTAREVGSMLGVSFQAVLSLEKRALTNLRKNLSKRGITATQLCS